MRIVSFVAKLVAIAFFLLATFTLTGSAVYAGVMILELMLGWRFPTSTILVLAFVCWINIMLKVKLHPIGTASK